MTMDVQSTIAAASNVIDDANGTAYTETMFKADFPQFYNGATGIVPSGILATFIGMANATVLQARYLDAWRYAAGLYTAHYATQYLQAYAANNTSAAQVVGSAGPAGLLTQNDIKETISTQFSYSELLEATAKWGGLNATHYGRCLVDIARLVGAGGSFVI